MQARPIDRRVLVPAVLLVMAGSTLAQTEAPPTTAPTTAPVTPATTPPAAPAAEPPKPERLDETTNRRVLDGPDTVLAFKNVKVSDLIPFIVEATGKVVMPQPEVMTRSITVLNDRPIPRQMALDMVIMALHQIGVGVVEGPTIITLRDLNEVTRQDVPVVSAEHSLEGRSDYGSIVQKVYGLKNASAKNVGELIKDNIPDFAKVIVDEQSNQIAVLGNVGLLQRLEQLIGSLDLPAAASLGSETFRLRYADAEQVATNIKELFAESATRTGGQNQPQNPFQNFFNRGGNQNQGGRGNRNGGGNNNSQGGGGSGADIVTSANLRVTANTQQNSVTVLAERPILEQVRKQIDEFWDKPLPDEAVVPRVYDLKNSDPIKVRDLLEGLFGKGTSTATGGNNNSTLAQGVGRLAGQFSFQALPDSGRLIVVSKSPDNMAVIDKIIDGLDQPQSIGLPEVVELKHANAEDLAEQLNTLLAQDGTLAQIRRMDSGLSDSTLTSSPFAQDASSNTNNQNSTNNQNTTSAANISFWWQRSRPPTDKAGASNLVGAIRIVPVWRQNALLVLAPPEYRTSVSQLINQLDKPGRQVLISSIVAEVSSDDATALGLRWSSQAITPTNPDNAIQFGTDQNRSGFIGSLFNSSLLDVNMNVNVMLQALAQKTDVQILSEPKIFTSDNQEAEFFDGQDIPFVTDSQTNNNGNLVQSFDYRAVGIQLRIRPRIANNRDVDVRVNLQLSSIVPGETLFGGFIVDRRETTTQLILRDGQTVVISGIIRKEDSDITRKVPLLGDIPLLGALFTSKEKSVKSTELLVFITPIVVENPEERQLLNEPYHDRLQQMRLRLDGGQSPDAAPSKDAPDDKKDKKKSAQDFGYDG